MQITKDTHLTVSFSGKQNNVGAAMVNAGYEALNLNFIHVPITTQDIAAAITGVRGFNLAGCSVSMPHKQKVMAYLDKIDNVASTIGAVNSIGNDGGVLTGYNTDWIGATEALKEATQLKSKKVVVLGAGGAVRAIVYGLNHYGASVSILNRDLEKGKNLAKEFNATFRGGLEVLSTLTDYDILINATSVGFGTLDSPVPGDAIKRNIVVMDIVVVPAETTFLKHAKELGCTTIPGYRMLIHQALFTFELFTNKKPPFAAMEKALLDSI